MMQRSLNKSILAQKRILPILASPKSASTQFTRFNSTNKTKANDKNKANPQQQVFDPRFIGLTRDIYIPVAYSNFPNIFTNPKLAWNCLLRRGYVLGINTIQVALLRWQTGLKPQFLLWKNKSIERYVQVNKAFAAGDVKSIEKSVSVWVEKSLSARVNSIPKNVKLDWKLIKFNEKPKLVSFRPIMLPGKPVEFAQAVYKFNTQQELINVNLSTDKVNKIDRNVIDYVGFLINLDDNEVILAGSVFENKPTDRIPKPEDIEQSMIFQDMKINGDIYRAPPVIESKKD